MKIRFSKTVFGALLGAAILCAPIGATPVGVGSFDLSGMIEVTGTQVFFGLNTPPNNQNALVIDGSGAFTGLAPGQIATIKNIPSQPAFPSGALSIPQWIILPDGINLDLATAVINTTLPVCSGTSADNVIGFTCRPNATSPIFLQQLSTGVRAGLSLLGNAYTGTSATGFDNFNGLLTANFTQGGQTTISGLLGVFNTQGFITTGYAGNFTTTVIPEPGLLAGLGLGMLVLGSLRKKIHSGKA